MRFLLRLFLFVLYLSCAAFFLSCQRQPVFDTINSLSGETTSVSDQTDGEILRITNEAKAGLFVFFRHLARPEAGDSNFSVKYPFAADEGSGVDTEQVWLTGIYFKDGRYYGKLSGNPVHLSGMKKDDTVTIIADNITDWMYVNNGKIVGGLSIKYLLEQIPEYHRSGGQKKLLEMFEE